MLNENYFVPLVLYTVIGVGITVSVIVSIKYVYDYCCNKCNISNVFYI